MTSYSNRKRLRRVENTTSSLFTIRSQNRLSTIQCLWYHNLKTHFPRPLQLLLMPQSIPSLFNYLHQKEKERKLCNRLPAITHEKPFNTLHRSSFELCSQPSLVSPFPSSLSHPKLPTPHLHPSAPFQPSQPLHRTRQRIPPRPHRRHSPLIAFENPLHIPLKFLV